MSQGTFTPLSGVNYYHIENPKFVRNIYAGVPNIVNVLEHGTDETFDAGDIILLTSGLADTYAADGVAIAGLALEDAIGSATNVIPTQIIRSTDEYLMNFYNATPGDAQAQDIAIGATYGLVQATITYTKNDGSTFNRTAWVIDSAEATHVRVVITRIPDGYNATDVYPPVIVRFLNTDGINFNILQLDP